MIERLSPPGVPIPRGPYSPAVRAGGFLYVSGQIPIDPATNTQVSGGIQAETRQVLNNIKGILAGAGASIEHVVKCSVFLADAAEFSAMNDVYAEFFGEHKPARSTIVCGFVAPIRVEIDCIAYFPD